MQSKYFNTPTTQGLFSTKNNKSTNDPPTELNVKYIKAILGFDLSKDESHAFNEARLISYNQASKDEKRETIDAIQVLFDKKAEEYLALQKTLEVIKADKADDEVIEEADEDPIEKANNQIRAIIKAIESASAQLPDMIKAEVNELLTTRKTQQSILLERNEKTNIILEESKNEALTNLDKDTIRARLVTIENDTVRKLNKTGLKFETALTPVSADSKTTFFIEMKSKISKQGRKFANSINNFFKVRLNGIKKTLEKYIDDRFSTDFINLFPKRAKNTPTPWESFSKMAFSSTQQSIEPTYKT